MLLHNGDLSSSFFKLLLRFFSFLLRNAFLELLRQALNQLLRLLQRQAREMSCDVFVQMQCNYAIANVYHATYKMRTICAHILMHIHPCIIWTFILKCIQIPNHDIQHSTYQVQERTCILTKFLNIPWIIIINTYNSRPCTTHVNISYNIH